MARRASEAEDENGEVEEQQEGGTITNERNRAKLIRAKRKELLTLNQVIAELNEQKKALGKERADHYREMKTKLGMARVHVETAFAMIDLEEGARNEALDTYREIYTAMGVGEQMDLFGTRPSEILREDRKNGIEENAGATA